MIIILHLQSWLKQNHPLLKIIKLVATLKEFIFYNMNTKLIRYERYISVETQAGITNQRKKWAKTDGNVFLSLLLFRLCCSESSVFFLKDFKVIHKLQFMMGP